MRPWKAATIAEMRAAASELQWGHDLAAVEGLKACALRFCTEWLQWGHDLAAVEGGRLR